MFAFKKKQFKLKKSIINKTIIAAWCASINSAVCSLLINIFASWPLLKQTCVLIGDVAKLLLLGPTKNGYKMIFTCSYGFRNYDFWNERKKLGRNTKFQVPSTILGREINFQSFGNFDYPAPFVATLRILKMSKSLLLVKFP